MLCQLWRTEVVKELKNYRDVIMSKHKTIGLIISLNERESVKEGIRKLGDTWIPWIVLIFNFNQEKTIHYLSVYTHIKFNREEQKRKKSPK